MIRASLPIALALGIALASSACSHADTNATTAASAAPSPLATRAPAASETSNAQTTVDATHESVSKDGTVSSIGAATESDLSQIGLPIYPTITLENTFLVKHIDKKTAAFRFQANVKDDVATVAAYYEKQLGKSFKENHIAALGGLTSFARRTATSNESILLQASKDKVLDIGLTTITMTVTRRR